MLKAKRCAKEAQKPTALETLLQNLAKAQEEAIAPKRKKARGTKQEQPQTADAEAAAESETEQEEMDQMRDTDEANEAAAMQQKQQGWERWSAAQHTKWKKKRSKELKRNQGGWG